MEARNPGKGSRHMSGEHFMRSWPKLNKPPPAKRISKKTGERMVVKGKEHLKGEKFRLGIETGENSESSHTGEKGDIGGTHPIPVRVLTAVRALGTFSY